MKNLIRFLLVLPLTAFGQTTLTTAQIAKRVSPSVVVIQGKTDSGDVLGSGFIVSKDGRIVTNLHVIREMKTASVQLAHGEVFNSLSVLGTDERADLAIVQIAGHDLPTLEMGYAYRLSVGEPVVVVGSPRGLEGTVTAGILSGVRDVGEGFQVLQTDAAVNPGNSGGPLVNGKGQTIGVVSFKLKSSEGLNFAIPIKYVQGLLNNLHKPMPLEHTPSGTDKAPAATNVLPPFPLPDLPASGDTANGPSLKETLDWLETKIGSATITYVDHFEGQPVEVAIRGQAYPSSSAACVLHLNQYVHYQYHTYAKTLLAEVNTYLSIPLDDDRITLPAEPHSTLYGDQPAYAISVATKSKFLWNSTDYIYRVVRWDTVTNPVNTKSELVSGIFVPFSDESTARRALSAFQHAADLCRKNRPKEPF
jgi:hypothetical protein